MTYDKASSKLDVGGKRYGYDELLCSHTKKLSTILGRRSISKPDVTWFYCSRFIFGQISKILTTNIRYFALLTLYLPRIERIVLPIH